MILTGKAKNDFFNHFYNGVKWTHEDVDHFCQDPETVQFAQIIECFDSFGIYIDVGVNQITDKNTNKSNCNFDVAIFHPHHRTDEGRTLTQLNINISRQEATKQAIIKANQIYNDR